ncbi:MAG: bifunctional diaminohydroxyphosphoribosylaminopyrimidine deaminase/5-amino-6-(5-phosphoribosylamino)uracil reductase RibD, partial [Bdellovibrionales bacterium]|nr:bifunctional diaminohydroxyphosphoribosylaminopyrimidine deaminase/5-amino-6-(5-phosphoribosylamino)uracil reductase RibD [Bdellovibrionales bacterium]
MGIAIGEAKRGLGIVSPNPPVGCVVLNRNGQLIAKGHHRGPGTPHAEIEALSQVKKEELAGATFVVTLEPCSHFGRTPPCADALAKLPIEKVIYGRLDPNPVVHGRGVAKIKEAGIEALPIDCFQNELKRLIEAFEFNQKSKKAFISLKVASTLDGKMAHVSGESQWITNEKSRAVVHELREEHDAVMVGSNTVLVDNPKLDIRNVPTKRRCNRVVVIDPNGEALRKSARLRLIEGRDPDDIVFVTNRPNWDLPFQQISAFEAGGNLNFDRLKSTLFEMGICSVLVEGGSVLYSTLLEQNAVNRIHVFLAPSILGDLSGVAW